MTCAAEHEARRKHAAAGVAECRPGSDGFCPICGGWSMTVPRRRPFDGETPAERASSALILLLIAILQAVVGLQWGLLGLAISTAGICLVPIPLAAWYGFYLRGDV